MITIDKGGPLTHHLNLSLTFTPSSSFDVIDAIFPSRIPHPDPANSFNFPHPFFFPLGITKSILPVPTVRSKQEEE